MRLFVGLGNPGKQYENNRHNVGFQAVDRLIHRYNFAAPRRKFDGFISEGTVAGERLLLLQPQTFMNESGISVQKCAKFYKLTSADITVFYDELDLAFGKIKVKTGGGAAGHNGIRSMVAHMGPDFERVRIGIDHPGDKSLVTRHVLGDFSKAESQQLDIFLDAIADQIHWLVKRDPARFMGDVARRLQGAPEPAPAGKPSSEQSDKDAHPQPKASGQIIQKQEGPMAAMLRALKGDK